MALSGSPREPGSPNPLCSSLYEIPGCGPAWRLDSPAHLAQGEGQERGRERGAARLEPRNLLSCHNSRQGLPGPRTIFLNGALVPARGIGQHSSANCRPVLSPGSHLSARHTTVHRPTHPLPSALHGSLRGGGRPRVLVPGTQQNRISTAWLRHHEFRNTQGPWSHRETVHLHQRMGAYRGLGREGGACRGRDRRVGALGHVLSLQGQQQQGNGRVHGATHHDTPHP